MIPGPQKFLQQTMTSGQTQSNPDLKNEIVNGTKTSPPQMQHHQPQSKSAVSSETNNLQNGQQQSSSKPQVVVPPLALKNNSAFATMQPANAPITQEKPGLGMPSQNAASGGAHKVPPLNFNSTFNLNDAPLLRLYETGAGQSSQNGASQNNLDQLQQQPQYLTTNQQQMLTTEMDALRRPPVTVKQTDIIFLPDKGVHDSVIAFDVSRKQADLPPIQPDYSSMRSGASSARGSSTDRGSGIEKSAGVAGSNSYRGTSVAQPGVSHHYKDLGDLMILSSKEASLTHRMHIRDNLKARVPLGCPSFQDSIAKGILAITCTPDGHSVAILTRNFTVMIYDKVKEKTYKTAKIDEEYFDEKHVEEIFEQLKINKGNGSTDRFQIYVSNALTSIYVVSESNKIVATWSKMFESGDRKPKGQGQPSFQSKPSRPAPAPEARPNRLFARSNSASKALEKNSQRDSSRSTSRLRDFFRMSPRKQQVAQPEKEELASGKQSQNKVLAQLSSRSQSQGGSRAPIDAKQKASQVKHEDPELLQGHWTNITLHSLNKQDTTLQVLASSNTTQYNLSNTQESTFSSGLPMRLGTGKKTNILGEFQEEGSLISVKMYDYQAYLQMFETQLYSDLTNEMPPSDFKQTVKKAWKGVKDLNEMDQDTRKVLVLSQQFVEQDKVYKGNVWYQNPFYLIEKVVLATEIEYMGILQEHSNDFPQKRNLISKCDNQGNLLAIAVNSVHKIYCQILFVSLKNQFVSVMKLFEFVSAEDNPPFDSKGKTNLQVDDIAWTRNDAFLILMFNTGALAVLPRLGSQLLKIYNPTIINVHYKDAQNFSQYRVPRGFNELIPKNEIVNKVKKYKKAAEGSNMMSSQSSTQAVVSANSSTGYRLAMHPSEEAFIVYSGSIAYIMQLELEPQIDQLFEQENKNYYFMRFCFSMKSLSRDQETLQKIPQLLTSKLPICEFDKNQEKLENNDETDIAKRIQTASQINPWQMDNKRMDTIQSFDADFDEESEKVLLNFKHLLFSYRWNAATTLNYLEWLVTITNDIFFYYLKQSEPMYAYHTLKISEYYITKVLQKPQNINQYKLMDSKHTNLLRVIQQKTFDAEGMQRPDQAKVDSFRLLGRMFQGLQQRMMDPVIEIYTHGVASKTLQDEVCADTDPPNHVQETLKHLMPEEKDLAQKIIMKSDFLNQLPVLVADGDGNTGFSFQKNYTLLAFYCLIQFRNYQASNFNILFLILASYIVKNHVNATFVKGLEYFTTTILENFVLLEKTDELDLFFGKCGRNMIVEPPQNLQAVQKWVELVAPRQTSFSHKVLNKKTIYQIQSQNYQRIVQNHNIKTATQPYKCKDLPDNEQDNKKMIRPEVKPMIDLIASLEALDYEYAIGHLKQIAKVFAASIEFPYLTTPTQALGVSLTLFANSIYYLAATSSGKSCKSLSMTMALECITRQSIKLDKKSPINTVSQHIKIYDSAFVNCKSLSKIATARSSLMSQLGIKCPLAFKKFSAMLLAYSGDYQRSAQLLKPGINQKANMDLLIFNMLLQATALKNHSKNFLHLRDILQDYSMKNIKDFASLHRTTERLNAMHVVKFTMAEVSCTMNRIMTVAQNSYFYREYLWACFQMLPLGVAIIFKEQIARDSIINIKSILAFQIKTEEPTYDTYPLKIVINEFPLAKSFFEKTLEGNCEHLEYILPTQAIVRRRFFQQVELILICLYDQHQDVVIFDTTDMLAEKSIQRKKSGGDQTAQITTDMVSDRVLSLICSNFKKFGKIFSYLKMRTDIRAMDSQVKLYQQTNPGKAIECQFMICCKSLQHMVHFPKYTNVSFHTRRALALLTHLLFHTNKVISFELKTKIILPIIKIIQYNKLSRQNKQILSGILELSKTRLSKPINTEHQEEDYEPIVKALETCIFDRGTTNISAANDGRQQRNDDDSFEKMIDEVLSWMIQTILPQIDFKKLNIKGHRRCIQAKKDLFAHASIMYNKLGLPMTDCSLFFRGVNFEIKHINSFGLSDNDLQLYYKLQDSDMKEADQKQKGHLLSKNSNHKPQETTAAKQQTQDGKGDDEGEDDMNKTRVEKFTDKSIIHEMKKHTEFPQLELEVLCMGNHQLFEVADLPQNLDMSDTSVIIGSQTLSREMHYIDSIREQKEYEKQQAKAEKVENEKQEKIAAQIGISEEITQMHQRKNSQPKAFMNEFSLSAFSESQETKTLEQKTAISKQASIKQDSIKEIKDEIEPKTDVIQRTAILKMGRILAKKPKQETLNNGVTKITLRKNSARRRIAAPDNIQGATKEQISQKKYLKSQMSSNNPALPPRAAKLPPKAGSKRTKDPQKEEDGQESSEITEKKKKFQPFNLVFLKKKNNPNAEAAGEEKQQFKVKMPFKMITKNVIKQNAAATVQQDNESDQVQERREKNAVLKGPIVDEQGLNPGDQRGRTKKIKPFQVQLIKVNKKSKPESINPLEAKEAQSKKNYTMVNMPELVQNAGKFEKSSAMMALMDQLNQIQEKADTLKLNLNKQNNTNQDKQSQ